MTWHTCGVATTVEAIGGRWKSVVLYFLLSGRKRFGELRRLLPGVSPRMLTLQLRELERDGLISRHVYAEVPPRVDYALTPLGESLRPVLMAMRAWGETYSAQRTSVAGALPVHDGTAGQSAA